MLLREYRVTYEKSAGYVAKEVCERYGGTYSPRASLAFAATPGKRRQAKPYKLDYGYVFGSRRNAVKAQAELTRRLADVTM